MFNLAPADGFAVELSYATINYSGNPSYVSAVIDINKPLSDIASAPTDRVSAKDFAKGTINETITSADSNFQDVIKLLPDAETIGDPESTDNDIDWFVMDDDISTKGVTKPLADAQLVYEELTNFVGKSLGTSRDGVLADITALADTNYYRFTKPLTDATDGTIDSNYYQFTKPLLDATDGTVDAISTFGIGKSFTDTTDGKTDAISTFGIGKSLTDTTDGTTDAIPIFSIGKALTDATSGATDALGYSYIDGSGNTIIVPAIAFNKYITDNVTIDDTGITFFPSYNPIESLTLSESTLVGTTKPISESITLTESSVFIWGKGFTETITFTEAITGQYNPYSSNGYFPVNYQNGYVTIY